MKKIFLATVMSGFRDAEVYAEYREGVLALIAALEENYEVYSEMQRASSEEAFSCPEKAVKDDFQAIEDADIFLMLHPCRVQSSTLMELGYACALKKDMVIVGEAENLPYMALGLVRPAYNAVRVEASVINRETIEKITEALGELCE